MDESECRDLDAKSEETFIFLQSSIYKKKSTFAEELRRQEIFSRNHNNGCEKNSCLGDEGTWNWPLFQ